MELEEQHNKHSKDSKDSKLIKSIISNLNNLNKEYIYRIHQNNLMIKQFEDDLMKVCSHTFIIEDADIHITSYICNNCGFRR